MHGSRGRNLIDPDDVKRNRGVGTHNVAHQWVFNLIYDLPFGPGGSLATGSSGIVAKLIEGRQVSTITTLATSTPRTAILGLGQSRSRTTGRSRTEVPNLKPGADSNPVIGDPDRYWDFSSFELQPEGFFGDLGRNTLRVPDYASLDIGITKNFSTPALSETARVQFRFEAFNILNRTNFGLPANRVFRSQGRLDATFGRITETATTARQLQFALKVIW